MKREKPSVRLFIDTVTPGDFFGFVGTVISMLLLCGLVIIFGG